MLRGLGVRDDHEERARPRTYPLAQFIPQLRRLQGLVRDNKTSAHDNHPLQSIPQEPHFLLPPASCARCSAMPRPPAASAGRVSVTLCDRPCSHLPSNSRNSGGLLLKGASAEQQFRTIVRRFKVRSRRRVN
jgi:hypothetical protein